MGRWKKGDAAWREDYRKVSKCFSLPTYIMKDLEAQGKPSVILSDLCEVHKDNIGDGVFRDAILRRKELIALIVEDILKDKMAIMMREIVEDAVDQYVEESAKDPRIKATPKD